MNGNVDVAKDTDRGTLGQRAKDTDRGLIGGSATPVDVASDLFQRASQLGGLLVVAVVAPLGSSVRAADGVNSVQRALLNIGEDALKKQLLEEQEQPESARAHSLAERQAYISGR